MATEDETKDPADGDDSDETSEETSSASDGLPEDQDEGSSASENEEGGDEEGEGEDHSHDEDGGHDHHDHGDDPDEVLVSEPDRVNVGVIGAITVAIVVSTVAVVIGVHQFFTQTIAGEVNKKVYEPEDPAKKELAAVEAAKLSKYQWASQKDGIVRIPKDRARELVLAEYGKLPPYQPGAIVPPAPSTTTEAPPDPAPAPSASTSVEGMPSGTPAPSGSVAPSASALKPGMAPSASASAHHAPHGSPHKKH